MRGSASVTINRLPPVVFDFLTDPRKAAYWHGAVLRYDIVEETPEAVGSQTRWVFGGNGYEVEAIETVVAHERPHLFASQHYMTRFLRGPARPGESPPNEAQLEQQFRMAYGSGTPGGMLLVEITPEGDAGSNVTMTVESDLRGAARISSWVARLLGRSPLQQNIIRLKDRIESET